MTAAEFLADYRKRKAQLARLANERDQLKRRIAEADTACKEAYLVALKDGVVQIGSCYDMGDGTVAVAFRTEKGPQLAFFDKA